MGIFKLVGDGTIPQGEYEGIKVIGNPNATGNIKTGDVKITGNSRFEGELSVSNLKETGNFEAINKVTSSGTFRVMGNAYFKDEASFNECKMTGNCEFSKKVYAHDFKVLGNINVKNDFEAENFESRGRINIDGLLSGEKIDILVDADCSISEIGGTDIIVRNKQEKKGFFFNRTFSGVLTVDVIEGDNIELANTVCRIVRGNNITINEGCKIESLEYTGEININDKSEVGDKVWMKN